MTTTEKLTIGVLGGIAIYAASMFDGRLIYDPEELIDCKVGKYFVIIKKTDCIGTIEYAITHPKRLITRHQVPMWWVYYRQQQAYEAINN